VFQVGKSNDTNSYFFGYNHNSGTPYWWCAKYGVASNGGLTVRSGSVGVGTVANSYNFEVNGTAKIYGWATFFNTSTSTSPGFGIEDQGTFTRIAMREWRWYDWNGAGDFLWLKSGKVGIGKVADRKLHVYDTATSGAGPFVVDQFATTGFTDTITLIRGGQGATSSWNACIMQANSGSTNIFYVRGDGYTWANYFRGEVYVSTPTLYAGYNSYISGNEFAGGYYYTDANPKYWGVSGSGYCTGGMEVEMRELVAGWRWSQRVHIRTHQYNVRNGRCMTITEYATVGINQESPGYTLDVNGSFRASGTVNVLNRTTPYMALLTA
jgi:hypothetical protein